MNNTIVVNQEVTITDQDIDDIMVTALEGGINYWCSKAEVKDGDYKGAKYASDSVSKGSTLILHDAEDPDEKYLLTKEKILHGIREAIMEGRIAVALDGTIDCCDVDADVADAIIQHGALGEIVFG